MSDYDRIHWDERYASAALDMTPSPLVVDFALRVIVPQRALDVACGAGRNALYLAILGYSVDAVDISTVALGALEGEARARGLSDRVRSLAVDLDIWRPKPAAYALAVQIAFFDPQSLPSVLAAVKPGGLLILEAFNPRRLETRPTFNPAHLIGPGVLPAALAGWSIVHHDEAAGERGDRTQIVAQRPE